MEARGTLYSCSLSLALCVQRACLPRSLLGVIERESGAAVAEKAGKSSKTKSRRDSSKKRRLSSRSDGSSHENSAPSSLSAAL